MRATAAKVSCGALRTGGNSAPGGIMSNDSFGTATQATPTAAKTSTSTYAGAIEARMKRDTTAKLRAVPLSIGAGAFDGKRPFNFCLCVTAEGCPCDDFVFWVEPGDIVEEVDTGTKDSSGRGLVDVVVPKDAFIVIERTRAIHAGALEAAKAAKNKGGKLPGKSMAAVSGLDKAGPAGAVLAAFMAGWTLGTQADAATDGAISDAGADLIEWIVDLF